MSLFKKPKKSIVQRRVFSSENDYESVEKMEVDETVDVKDKKQKEKKEKISKSITKSSLLSFGDEEEDGGEVFQVKKSSYSRKIHKERKKEKKSSGKSQNNGNSSSHDSNSNSFNHDNKSNYAHHSDSNYFKEIQSDTDGFSIRLKNSNPGTNMILNGRAALCAGRNEMSSEDEEEPQQNDRYSSHKFSQPDEIKLKLESGAIPDAAMIHAARKRRQKAREQSDFVAIEEPKEDSTKGKRNFREDDADGSSGEEERVDMNAITGVKEFEERREQFYSIQTDNLEHDDSDIEVDEWENQQIRKGVTGAQIMTVQQESTFAQYLIPPLNSSNKKIEENPVLTTAELLEQAYSQSNHDIAKQLKKERKKETTKGVGIKTPQEIMKNISNKLRFSRELNHKHYLDIERITEEFETLKVEIEETTVNKPKSESNYRFYIELKLYLRDLVECLDEKLPLIIALEEKFLSVVSKYAKMLIERRRQDVRDQAKEITDIKSVKKMADDEERTRRAAEREGRRTRRRRHREKLNMNESHNEGFSSDEEVPDIELSNYRDQIAQINSEALMIFDDVADEYCELSLILKQFNEWKKKDLNTYKEAFAHMSLPKIVGVFVRWYMISWSPFSNENYEDIDKMKWFNPLAVYARIEHETEETLRCDPDIFLIPKVVEKIVLAKLNTIIEGCFDPLSTTQTLKLVKLLKQLANEYPSLRITSKNLQLIFVTITDKMKIALDNDVFIPIFQKQASDTRSSVFFQRQFFSGIKLFRNFISFQGIIADSTLKNFAISSLLNRYLLSAMRVSSPIDGLVKAQTIINAMPRSWLVMADKNFIESMNLFVIYVGNIEDQLDKKSSFYSDCIERLKQIHNQLEMMVKT